MINDPRLDRLVQFDERSRNYPVTAIIKQTQPRSYSWGIDVCLDQGREGACVGFALAHELRAKPKVVAAVDTNLALRIYREAQKVDPWPGEAYSGTSVLAGVQTVQAMGHLSEYRWAFGADDLALAVSRTGPAVLGIPWYDSMYTPHQRENSNPRDRHYITVSGTLVGGHAILCRGYNVRRREFLLRNSWGKDWGYYGDAWVSHDDLDTLLRTNGEAVIPIRR